MSTFNTNLLNIFKKHKKNQISNKLIRIGNTGLHFQNLSGLFVPKILAGFIGKNL